MPTPAQEAARSFHQEQAAIAATGAQEVFSLLRSKAPWSRVLAAFATAQFRSAANSVHRTASWGDSRVRSNPRQFAGVTSLGFELQEPIIATIDRVVPAPAEALPAPWWDEAGRFVDEAMQLLESEIQDAGRSAAQAEMIGQGWQNYVRVLVPPSCKRCVVLAGRIYRDLDGFERHPKCDCQNVPAEGWEQAHDAGLVSSPGEAFAKGHIRDLTAGERRAIEDGADPVGVINSSSGIYVAGIHGRRVKATTYGTTKRAAWRRANPSKPVRLRPEAIYRLVDREYGGSQAEARRLLKVYGYLNE